MKRMDDLQFGWVDTSIHSLLETQRAIVVSFAYALITSIDSAADLRRLPTGQMIVQRYPQCGFLGTGLVVPIDLLARIGKEFNLFNGFDEVWLFREEPRLLKPDDVILVAPLDLREDAISHELCDWVYESGCEVGLGDGIGLNYVTRENSVAAILECGKMELP